ncbi:hypothetical protein RIR_jg32415.t1 [Rhizophagus irregularis DAOM 181602=DAOM 197198]|nr:hypothetical protein RIR_jg32415.t1 [Rhizophagus irregularis DAOM 181602=DAOM 197198]
MAVLLMYIREYADGDLEGKFLRIRTLYESVKKDDLHYNIMMLIHQNIKLANLGLSNLPNKYALTPVPNTPEDYVKFIPNPQILVILQRTT